ncbi:MAG: response regulator [Chloroflexi bacterium]|nr:response regulator [Chloroflexota bacterium]
MAVILIIEDDAKFVRLVEKILGVQGHHVIHAGTALDGLRLADLERVNLVLLDMDLPDLDGKVVANALRSRPAMQQIPIIAVTAQDDAITRRLVVAFGCNGFIPKPIDTRQFCTQVAEFLSKGNKP